MKDEAEVFLDETVARGQSLMTHLNATHADPFEALATCVITLAALAKGISMPLEELQAGITAAYEDMGPSEEDKLQ